MRGAINPLPNTPSWRGAQLKHRDNFTFCPFKQLKRLSGEPVYFYINYIVLFTD
jgi:hypothetical protein